MKFRSAILALLASATGAAAADLPRQTYTRAPAMVAAPAYNWSGLYLGAHFGGAFAGDDFFGNNDARLMGGGQIGVDFQFAPSWVLGIEANYSFVDSNDSGLNFFGNRNLGSVTGRLGYAWGPTLLYAKGGYAWADTRHSFGFGGDVGESGYTIGGGLEYMFAPNWSAKLEYQYYDFGDVTFTSAPPVVISTFNNAEHTIKLGVNYRFNWGAGRY
jgi:outer membrane immunogenic protein